MLTAERRQMILEQLQSEKKVIVSQLSSRFGVSDETIRRDLNYLCSEGLAIKGYGGAIVNESGHDLPFNVRKMHKPAEKRKIAELLEGLVNDNESILLDASTTAVFAAQMLKKKSRLTVVTNSIKVMLELADKPDCTVITTGGRLMGDYLAFAGQRAVSELAAFHVDKLIFSCKGLDTVHGICESNDDFAQIKQAMIKAAGLKILAADLSKFDKPSFSKIADFNDIDIVVTDGNPGPAWLEFFTVSNVRCIYPNL